MELCSIICIAMHKSGLAAKRSATTLANNGSMNDRHGHYFKDLEPGMSEVFSKTITEADLLMFAGVSGDTNPLHLDEDFASRTMFESRIAHGMLTASLVSTVLGTRLPGPGAVYVSQSVRFLAPVRIGDTVIARDQAAALRRLADERWNGPLDLLHLAEEVEDLGSEQQWAVESQLERIIEHF